MVLRSPVKAAYNMLSEDWGQLEAESLLFITLAHWDRISEEIAQCVRKSKKTLAEYVIEATEATKPD